MKDLARRHGKTPAQVIFHYALEGGMLPITGTRNAGPPRDRSDGL